MTNTINLKLDLLKMNQSQKEITVNEALVTIDSLMNNCVIDFVDNLPLQASDGDLYIINKNNQLAYYFNGWRYLKPKEGFLMWLKTKRKLLVFTDNFWKTL